VYVGVALVVIVGSAILMALYSWPAGMLIWLLVFVAGTLFLLVRWHARATAYRCSACGEEFTISAFVDFFSPHIPDKKLLKCPKCGKRGWSKILMRDSSD
jgi:DNA-directed RNA polymerase subunit RPC12/RpoP